MSQRTNTSKPHRKLALAAVIALAVIASLSAPDSAFACRPDMEPWSNACGTP